MDGLGFRTQQVAGELEGLPLLVEWFPVCWLRCDHGCGLHSTAIARVSLLLPGRQRTMQICLPCLERVAVDPVFRKEVSACL